MKTSEELINYMLEVADKLDNWAEQSERGGWSTHQVEVNRLEAAKIRKNAFAYARNNGVTIHFKPTRF